MVVGILVLGKIELVARKDLLFAPRMLTPSNLKDKVSTIRTTVQMAGFHTKAAVSN